MLYFVLISRKLQKPNLSPLKQMHPQRLDFEFEKKAAKNAECVVDISKQNPVDISKPRLIEKLSTVIKTPTKIQTMLWT